ncbi:MAG: glycosyltransferase [Pyrinomonadaceae bacterium]
MQDGLQHTETTRRATERVFVVVPSYNHAQFVEKCLRSVMAQTAPPMELLVIDDGSDDDSPGTIARVLQDCPFPCDLLVRPNRGLAATLNEGLKHGASRDFAYFAYVGSDDVWLPSFLEARVAILGGRSDAVLAYGNAFSIDETDTIIDSTTEWAAYVDGDARKMLMTTLAPLSPTVVYRRNMLERHSWNESARLEDYELYLRLSGEGEFAFDPQVLSAWRVHGKNASLDFAMMINEKLAAQDRVGIQLGFTQQELKKFQSLARFRTAQEYMRRNDKRIALRLMLRDLRGIQSLPEAVRMAAGLLAPGKLLQWRKSRRQAKASQRYGSVKI